MENLRISGGTQLNVLIKLITGSVINLSLIAL